MRKDDSVLCELSVIEGQQVVEFRSEEKELGLASAYATSRFPKRRITLRDPRPASKGNGRLWHNRMGHPGPMSLHELGKNSLGVSLLGPRTVECEFCAKAKIKRQVARRPPNRIRNKPGYEIHIDWTDLEESYEGFVRIMFITDATSGLVFPYFMSTHGTEKENLRVLKDFIEWWKKRYGLEVKIIRSDNELGTKKIRQWLRDRGIDFEPSAARTQAQNGLAERSGGVIMQRARAMRLAASLPHNIWKEIVNCAVYLYNRTPRESNGWKTPYEVFFSQIGEPRKSKQPQLAHLKAYGCRVYAMTPEAQEKKNRLWKLDSRAYIGYLVGYDSTNIFRIWIPYQGKVISTRDVLFDENTFFNGKMEDFSQALIKELDELIARIELPKAQASNEKILEEDEEMLDPVFTDDSQQEQEQDQELIADFNQEVDLELAKALEEALLTPPETDCEEGESQEEQDRFEAFQTEEITSAFQGAFLAGRRFRPGPKEQKKIHKRDLPLPPKTQRDLQRHSLKDLFIQAQKDHLDSHKQMKSFQEIDRKCARGQQILGCM
jgi:transposase InsO family protein